jgi:hypothetical protein
MINTIPLEIDESRPEYEIERLSPTSESCIALWGKHMTMYQQWARFWQERIETGKKCHRFMRRDIFEQSVRDKYMYVEGKLPIEPQEMKPVINALTDQITQRVKGYIVTSEDEDPPEGAATPEVIDVVLKWLTNKLKLINKREECLRNGLIDGYPQWIMFDKRASLDNPDGEFFAWSPKWDTTLPSPRFEEPDGSDISELMIVSRMTKAELLEEFPDRAEALSELESAIQTDPGFLSTTLALSDSMTAAGRQDSIYDMIVGASMNDQGGLYTVITHLFSVMKKQTVFISEAGDVQVLPENWTPEEKQQWQNDNPDYTIKRKQEVPTLWATTIGTGGFVWQNKQHWFQKLAKGRPYSILPGVCYVASLEDAEPTGFGEDLLPYILLIASCATEGLSEVRRGTGRTTFIEEGNTLHPKTLRKELSDAEGIVLMKKEAVKNGAVRTETRKPNDTFLQMEDRYRGRMKDAHRVNDAMMGQSMERQSAVAKDREVTLGMSPQAPYVKNYQHFCWNLTQILCYMMPYAITEKQVLEIDDEFNNTLSVTVNKPELGLGLPPASPVSGLGGAESAQPPAEEGAEAPEGQEGKEEKPEMNIHAIFNDLAACDYRIIPVPGDDSATTLEQDTQQFARIMEAVGNSFVKLMQIDPKMLGMFLVKWHNRIAREMGQWIIENAGQLQQAQGQQAQAEMQQKQANTDAKMALEREKIHSPIVSFKVSPADVQAAPIGFKMMMAMAQNQQNGAPATGATPTQEAPGGADMGALMAMGGMQ